MDIRVRLLFQGDDLVDKWSGLNAALLGLEVAVEHGHPLVPAKWFTEENERQTWGLIVDAGRKVEATATETDDAIRKAMSRIDTE